MNKTCLSAAILAATGLLGSASLAHADVIQDVKVLDGAGNTLATNIRSFDWSAGGSGVAQGAGSGPLSVGQEIPFLYQADLARFLNPTNGLVNPSCTIGSTCEWTVVANATEVVAPTSSLPGQANFTFKPGSTQTASIFYDTTPDADYSTGTGFDDGIEIARFQVVEGTADFNATTNNGSTRVTFATVFTDPLYIQGIDGLIIDLAFKSTEQLPSSGEFVSTQYHIGGSAFYPDYTATSADLLFVVDGLNTFSKAPEPGSLLLIGTGLLGLGAVRRRFHKAVSM